MELLSDEVGCSLNELCPGGVTRQADLRMLSRWRIGGKVAWLVEPACIDEVSAVVRYANKQGFPLVVIGDGSNLLFDDEGLGAIVMKVGRKMSSILPLGEGRFHCQAGVWIPRLARRIGGLGHDGMQHTIGIPGTLGGLVCMNGGSQRRGIGENVVKVTVVERDGSVRDYSQDECAFAYRQSIFQSSSAIIVEVILAFPEGDRRLVRREMIDIMRSRRTRFPLKLPNCGSVFVSDPAMYSHVGPPGKAIEDAGLKGLRVGNAQSSPQHANFIVNLGGATSKDVLGVIRTIREGVHRRTGFHMDCEVRYVAPCGDIRAAHEVL